VEGTGSDREKQIEAARHVWYEGFVAEAIGRFLRQPVMDTSGEAYAGFLKAVISPIREDHRQYHTPLNSILRRLLAEATFVSQRKAIRWLSRPTRALGGKTPMELLETKAGLQQVEDLLTRIDHGLGA
jgi:hypothetical protein